MAQTLHLLFATTVLTQLLGTSIAFTPANVFHRQPGWVTSHSRGECGVKLQLFKFDGLFKQSSANTSEEYDVPIQEAKATLYLAAETKSEDPGVVFDALLNLEKLMRKKRKAEPTAVPAEMLENLNGSWRLIFTTGTEETQKKLGGGKINYFPIKAVQSFDTSSMKIQNGIYLGDFALIRFYGDFEFDMDKCRLEFDFDQISVFGLTINLGKGKAAEIGAASGLGSENNKQLIEKNKKPFFNWISADEVIATARGGGGGLALWKKISTEE